MTTTTTAEFSWNRLLQRDEIADLLETCQREFNEAWESASVRVVMPAHLENVPKNLPVEKWADRLAPEKFELFGNESRYYSLECEVLYSPFTAIPVSVSVSRDIGSFYLALEFFTVSIFIEGIPIDESGPVTGSHAAILDAGDLDLDSKSDFCPVWTLNGPILKRLAENVVAKFTPDVVNISSQIMDPDRHARVNRDDLLTVIDCASSDEVL